MALYLQFVVSDPTFETEIRTAAFPEGLGGFIWTETIWAYEHQINCWPPWGPTRDDAETDAWTITGGSPGSAPAGVKMRGPYEVYLYGIQDWIDDVVNANVDAYVAWLVSDGQIADPDTYDGDLVLDFGEAWPMFSFSYFGSQTGAGKTPYQYFRDQTGLSASAARTAWEQIATSLYSAVIIRLRSNLPLAKIGDPYVFEQVMYQLDDSTGAPGASLISETGRTVANEVKYHRRGRVPPQRSGGLGGWLMSLASKLDWVDAELYNKIGYSTVDGASVDLGDGSITSSKIKDTEFYLRLHLEEVARFAAAMGKQARVWINPVYAVFGQGDAILDTGLNTYDAQLMVALARQYGCVMGYWIPASAATADRKQGIRDGLENLNPFLARYYGLSQG